MLNLIISISQMCVLLINVNILNNIKISKNDILYIVFVSPFISIIYTLNTLVAISVMIVSLFVYAYLKTKRIYKSLLSVILPFIFNVLISYLCSATWQTVIFDKTIYEVIALLGVLFSLVLSKTIIKWIYIILMKLTFTLFSWVILLLVFSAFFANIILSKLTEGDSTSNGMLILNITFMVIYIIITALIISVYSNVTYKSYRMKQEKIEHNNLVIYNAEIEKQYNSIRRFKHDYNNILLSMEHYITDEDNEGLKEYFKEHVKQSFNEVDKNDFKLISLSRIKVKEVKSLISAKVILAMENDIDINVEVVEDIHKINLNPIVLVRALGIIFDNAIEELMQIERGILDVSIYEKDNNTVIVVQNTCREIKVPIRTLKKKGFSTKGNNRGIGLSSLEEMLANEANVYWELLVHDNAFTNILTIGGRD